MLAWWFRGLATRKIQWSEMAERDGMSRRHWLDDAEYLLPLAGESLARNLGGGK
jgi:hypothetical protein